MNIFLDTIGCRLNQSEIERLGAQFRAAGHQLVGSAADAEIIVINTCSVTHKAASDSRSLIRRVGRGSDGQIIVTGCWATLEPTAAASMPSVIDVVDNFGKERLVPKVLNMELPTISNLSQRIALPGDRSRTRAFIKCQDGCNRACTYCITRIARGKSRSQPLDEIIKDIRSAVSGGTREVVLTGVQLSAWGRDFNRQATLVDLVRTILAQTSIPRIRLSSIEPWDLGDEFFDLFTNSRLCRHLHMPLQSGSPATLRRMARKTNLVEYQQYVESARAASQDIAVTTDVIVGFPGEDEREFNESLAFIRQIGFAQGHVFTYSPRPGTLAATFPDQIDPTEKKRRSALMRTLFQRSAKEYYSPFFGSVLSVLWESSTKVDDGWLMTGLTDNYLRVKAVVGADHRNQVDPVRLCGTDTTGQFIAEII